VLVYAFERDIPDPGGLAERDQVLGSLIGRTRAGILGALKTTSTTTELAHRLDVSLASASQHAAVLRSAGLISTHRQGGHVLHTLTALGVDLLNGDSSHA
jgi:DNA-binding transcriptional ArsR family regulator